MIQLYCTDKSVKEELEETKWFLKDMTASKWNDLDRNTYFYSEIINCM